MEENSSEQDSQQIVICKGIEQYLKQAVVDIERHSVEDAEKWINKAQNMIPKIGNESGITLWENRLKEVKTQFFLCGLFQRARPFVKRFRVYSRQSVNEHIFYTLNGLSRLIRKKVFVDELLIPKQIEFDERDENAFHAQVLVGDAPYCYSRTWICSGSRDNNIRWFVVDRLCTLNTTQIVNDGQGGQLYKGFNHRKQGCARYMLNELGHYLSNIAPKLNISIMVLHLHARSKPAMIQKLMEIGFRFVLTDEEVKKLQAGVDNNNKPEVVYLDGDRLRVNWISMYFPLKNSNPEKIQKDLDEVTIYARHQATIITDSEQIMRARENFKILF